MSDYKELVNALREAPDYKKIVETLRYYSKSECSKCTFEWHEFCFDEMCVEAADAIEELQAEVGQYKSALKGQEDGVKVLHAEIDRLKLCIDELREKQTYIDHYGDKWMTSAKDVPTTAYEHGYADGRDEAQLPKRGEWVEENRRPRSSQFVCSECHRTAYDPQPTRDKAWRKRCRYAYCPNCGADMRKMGVQE